jgi:hypothetical protein
MRELTAALGGEPTAMQKALIERTAMLKLRITLLDERLDRDGDGLMNEHTARHYISLHNSLERSLLRLSLLPKPKQAPLTPAQMKQQIERAVRPASHRPLEASAAVYGVRHNGD